MKIDDFAAAWRLFQKRESLLSMSRSLASVDVEVQFAFDRPTGASLAKPDMWLRKLLSSAVLAGVSEIEAELRALGVSMEGGE